MKTSQLNGDNYSPFYGLELFQDIEEPNEENGVLRVSDGAAAAMIDLITGGPVVPGSSPCECVACSSRTGNVENAVL